MHGGKKYGEKIELDMSVNINPLGMPENVRDALVKSIDKIEDYPDIEYLALKECIADYFGVKKETVVCANGASELIQVICYMLRPKRALIAAPSFSGYERALLNAGAEIYYAELKRDNGFAPDTDFAGKIFEVKPEIVFISNPNNPDGGVIEKEIGKGIIEACRMCGAHLVIDECFVELTDEGEDNSFKDMLAFSKGMIILRAFTKSYGMPGVRLGYGLCSDEMLAEWIKAFLPEWNVSAMAQEAGIAALNADTQSYFAGARDIIKREREYLTRELENLGMKVYASKANFILFRDLELRNLYGELKKKRVLIRDCSDYKNLENGHFRICVGFPEDNQRFIKALREII